MQKNWKTHRWIGLLLFCIAWIGHLSALEPEFFIVIPSFNNNKIDDNGKNWIEKNLESVFVQTNSNWTLCYINDCSKDGTGSVAEAYAEKRGMSDKCRFINNPVNKGALENLYDAISECPSQKVVVLLDGDDEFAHSKVLDRVAKEYRVKDTWITYGTYIQWPSGHGGLCRRIPKKVMKHNSFRKGRFVTSHLRTFYAKLFQKIKKEDLFYNGAFYRGGWDLAILFPMLEMASKGHIRYIKQVLYRWNNTNPISDCRVHSDEQRAAKVSVRALHRYKPLRRLFPDIQVVTQNN